jgi:Phosphate-induced protein 1 conserved region
MKGSDMTKNLQLLLMLLTVLVVGLDRTALAQTPTASQRPADVVKTDSRMLYHDGPVMAGAADIYLIWYGCWDDNCGWAGNTTIQSILTDFASSIGGSPYLQINRTYPNSNGQIPSGATFYAGAVFDRYSRGPVLTASDIQGIVADQIVSNALPQDPVGIYVVLASSDVSSNATGFCIPSAPPHHGTTEALGVRTKYAFVGNAMRCPSVAAPQFFANGTLLPSPNGSVAADAMASTLANLLNRVVTNPNGNAWFDRYGLENAVKCEGQFGETYLTVNGAPANLRLGQRDYLIQENWVNDRKGRCAMNLF